MRIAVISDVHSNLAALEAVLADLGAVDALWCLGDSVGYGPEPNACTARLEQAGALAVAGNHDRAAIGRLAIEDFNPLAAAAVRWTAEQLTPRSRQYLAALPERRAEGQWTLVHGSPRVPVLEYLFSPAAAAESFAHFATRFCLVGHTHVPIAFAGGRRVAAEYMGADATLSWAEDERRYILNPGSVGQPRDQDPRAAYLVLDTERCQATWRRVEYSIAATQALMAQRGLPRPLAERLSHGW
ncbi:MAG: metallophosphoesterase family protein [Chloroflexi bacterium]|nr:metallophosphoesterase family protein [Chloroflexota bacterium]